MGQGGEGGILLGWKVPLLRTVRMVRWSLLGRMGLVEGLLLLVVWGLVLLLLELKIVVLRHGFLDVVRADLSQLNVIFCIPFSMRDIRSL